MISNPGSNTLTQGTIFSCAAAEDYEGSDIHGLVITARCDISNDKAQIYNYLPVIPFQRWLLRDGAHILAMRADRAAEGMLKNVLSQAGHASSILATMPSEEVLHVVFDATDASSTVKKLRAPFHNASQRRNLARKCLTRSPDQANIAALLRSEKSERERLIRELCQNAVAEAYYLPRVSPGEDGLGHVVLLREMRHIPRKLALSIAAGLDHSAYQQMCGHDGRNSERLNIGRDDFAWPVGVLQSPFTEHLMQRLTLLFSRIGVTDADASTISTLQQYAATDLENC